jgi:hypothetical protein
MCADLTRNSGGIAVFNGADHLENIRERLSTTQQLFVHSAAPRSTGVRNVRKCELIGELSILWEEQTVEEARSCPRSSCYGVVNIDKRFGTNQHLSGLPAEPNCPFLHRLQMTASSHAQHAPVVSPKMVPVATEEKEGHPEETPQLLLLLPTHFNQEFMWYSRV